jgi:DNA-binding MarR family transcriptional regulator
VDVDVQRAEPDRDGGHDAPDPQDGRAKLISPTPRGVRALADAGDRVAEIEKHWAGLIGADRFGAACDAVQTLLAALEASGGDTVSNRP